MEKIVQDDQGAHAVTQQENRQGRFPRGYHLEKGFYVPAVFIPRIDVPPLAGGPAVSAEVEPIDLIAQRGQAVHHVRVASAVFAESVNDGQDSPGSSLRRPGMEV
jgi:hypothetical protein